jgi:protein-S-isoprenylcysteine O-methyltransferase Ste14
MRLLPPSYLFAAIVLQLVLHFFLPIGTLFSGLWRLLGLIPLAIGLVLNLRADAALHKANTTVKPDEAPRELVTAGPYGFSRHPMYLGFVLILFGVAALLGSVTPLLVVPIFGAAMEMVFIRKEEQTMAATFGNRWTEYRSRVRRWF